MLKALDPGDLVDAGLLRNVLESNVTSLGKTRGFLDACLDSVSITQRPTVDSARKATRVFATAELFERVALYMHPRDILHVIQVNKGTISIFKDSPKLKDKLSLRRAEDVFLYSVFTTEPARNDEDITTGFTDVDLEIADMHKGIANADGTITQAHRDQLQAKLEAFGDLPEVGPRCRDMLIFPALRPHHARHFELL